MAEEKKLKVTYYEKKPRTCPVCDTEFKMELLLTGSGRLIAGRLRDDLRRNYEPSKKYGEVFPLIYVAAVCPNCYYAALAEDFKAIDPNMVDKAFQEKENRIRYVKATFGSDLDFTEQRGLREGAASYFLAIGGYHYHTKDTAPTFKKGLCALRCSWVLEDLETVEPGENFGALIPFFLNKAKVYYNATIDLMQTGKENFDKVKFGPDIDKNFGYDGLLLLASRLTTKMSYLVTDVEQKAKELARAKKQASKIFGSGRASKSKPSDLLEFAKEVYNEVTDYMEELQEKHGIEFE